MRQIRDKVLDDVGVRQRVELDVVLGLGRNAACTWLARILRVIPSLGHTETRKGVLAVDVHRAATADTLSATPSEGQGRVQLVLDADERIEHHGAGLVEIEGVRLHARLLAGRLGVPAVDREGLHLGLFLLGWGVVDGGHAALEHGARRGTNSRDPAEDSRGGGAKSKHCGG